MTPIIDPISKELLKQELNEKTFLRKTNKADNEIYVVNAENSPNVLREIGRLREVSFRAVGGGGTRRTGIHAGKTRGAGGGIQYRFAVAGISKWRNNNARQIIRTAARFGNGHVRNIAARNRRRGRKNNSDSSTLGRRVR